MLCSEAYLIMSPMLQSFCIGNNFCRLESHIPGLKATYQAWKPHTRLSAYFVMMLGIRKVNLLGITPPNPRRSRPNLVHMHKSRGDNVHEISGAIGQGGVEWGAWTSPAQLCFSIPDDFLATFQRPIYAIFGKTRESMSSRKALESIFKTFPFRGHLPHKTSKLKGVKQAPHSDQPTPHRMQSRERLFTHMVDQEPGSFPDWSAFLYDVLFQSLCDVKVPQLLHFGLFWHTKCIKSIFLFVAYSPEVTLQNVSGYCVLYWKIKRDAIC